MHVMSLIFCFEIKCQSRFVYFPGGREVYSQSRAKSGRNKHHKQRHSGEFSHQQPTRPAAASNRRSTGYMYEVTDQNYHENGSMSTSFNALGSPTASVNPSPFSSRRVQEHQGKRTVIKETVFSSEVHSIEYNPRARAAAAAAAAAASAAASAAAGAPPAAQPQQEQQNTILGEVKRAERVVFDDIGDLAASTASTAPPPPPSDCDVNVTYDLIEGGFPPPSGLVVRSNEPVAVMEKDSKQQNIDDLLAQPGSVHQSAVGSLDNLCLGEEAAEHSPPGHERSGTVASMQSDNSSNSHRVIGDITIAEYEGSPRRYRPRPSNETTSNASSGESHPEEKTVAKLQQKRVKKHLANHPTSSSSSSITSDLKEQPLLMMSPVKTKAEKAKDEELLRFDEVTSQTQTSSSPAAAVAATSGGHKSDFDFRYEFSETRKVLDEFFHKAESEFPASAVVPKESAAAAAASDEFSDLNYTLRRCSPTASSVGSSYVGQRLAAGEEEPAATKTSVVANSGQNDLLLLKDEEKFSVPLTPQASDKGFSEPAIGLSIHQTPTVGLSPLEPLVSQMEPVKPHQTTTLVGHTRLNVATASYAAPLELKDKVEDLELQPPPLVGVTAPPAIAHQPPPPQILDSRNFTLSPETTDCDSADLESEVSINEGSYHSSGPKMHTSMPILEDGLSSGHASDMEDDVIYSR